MADILVLQDLIDRVGSRKIRQYYDDQNNGVLTDDVVAVDQVLSAAEGEFYSRIMRAYPGDPSTPGGPVQLLIANDPAIKIHLVSVGLQYSAERRPEFCDANGEGPYKAIFKRAIDYFETLSKGQKRSKGEAQAGQGANTGGKLQPKPPGATAQQFVFASSRDAPDGHGGF